MYSAVLETGLYLVKVPYLVLWERVSRRLCYLLDLRTPADAGIDARCAQTAQNRVKEMYCTWCRTGTSH